MLNLQHIIVSEINDNKLNIKKIIKEEIGSFIEEEYGFDDYGNEQYFNKTISKEKKKHSKKYQGRGVIWYGDPVQMRIVHKDNVHGMWGNVYEPKKLQFVKDLILNSEEYIEFECSYGLANIVNLQNIIEHQHDKYSDRFEIDNDGHDEPYSTGDDEIDRYLGDEDYLELENYSPSREASEFFKEHKFDIIYNKATSQQLMELYYQEIHEEDRNDNDYGIDYFIKIEERLREAFENEDGDIGKVSVQLRDGHHRVMGAIAAGEQYVAVNIEKRDLIKYGDKLQKPI